MYLKYHAKNDIAYQKCKIENLSLYKLFILTKIKLTANCMIVEPSMF